MRRTAIGILLVLLLSLGAVMVVSAQDVTVEPTSEVTVEPTLMPTAEVTVEPTAEVTTEPTAEATMEPTAEVTPVAPEMTATPSDDNGYLRIANFSPDAGTVDIFVNDSLAVRSLTYPAISQWFAVAPGSYTVAASGSGQTASDSLFAPVDVPVSGGTWQTVALVGSMANNTLQAIIVPEDYSDLQPSTGGLTFLNAVEGSNPVNLIRDDVAFFAQIGYPSADSPASSSSLIIDGGTFDLGVSDANDPTIVYAETRSVALPENGYTLVALIGTPDDSRLFVLTTDRSEVQIVRGLLPEPGQLLDAMRANENLTSFADALANGGMTETLSGAQQYTIFAPANFVVDNELNAQSALALRSYIVEGKYTSRQLIDAGTLTAVDGTTLTITTRDNGIYVNDVQLIDVNIPATNGVIHMLSGTWDNPNP